MSEYDAVIIGSGPNGLSAAITLQEAGLKVLILEAKATIGGGMRTEQVTLPGFNHDICSAIHPMAAASPIFNQWPLDKFGLEWMTPEIQAAHPLDNGHAALLYKDISETVKSLGVDGERYEKLIHSVTDNWDKLAPHIFGPLSIPKHPLTLASFGLKAMQPATLFGKYFKGEEAKALWSGMAAHSILDLNKLATSAIGLVLMSVAHLKGWPFPKGGSQQLANALGAYFKSLGGEIITNFEVKKLSDLPNSKAVLFDTSPKQLMEIAGHQLSSIYKWQLNRFIYGMGVYKIDWAIDGKVPFSNSEVSKAGCVHIGGTLKEIAAAEAITQKGGHPDKPFVLMAQQSIMDRTRAPEGKNAIWGYCHVPNGSTKDMTDNIENQIERFAPGFKDRIISKHRFNTAAFQKYNLNYIGGDINGGAINISQLFTRPALRISPYSTSNKQLFLCSASTPPGGGVHGACGYHAAKTVLKKVFKIE